MPRPWFVPLLAVALILISRATADIPARTPEQLLADAELAVTGVVVDVHTRMRGQSETNIYSIRVVSVIKGDARVGDTVLVSTWYRALLPGTVGFTGHRGLPSMGAATTVYARRSERSTTLPVIPEVLIPNGMQYVPPLFVTDELIKNAATTAADLDAAIAKAAAAGAWCEAERGARRAIELASTLEHHAMLVSSLLAQNKCKEAVAVALECVEKLKDAAPKVRRDAQSLVFNAAFHADDHPTMVRMEMMAAREINTPERWEEARYTLAFMRGPEAEAAAKEIAEKLPPFSREKEDIFAPANSAPAKN